MALPTPAVFEFTPVVISPFVVGINDLIPSEFAQLLQQVRGDGDRGFWTVGDVALALEGEADGNPDKQRAIRCAIAALAGVTAKTVSEYKAHAAYYPPEVRNMFPLCTRWHFRHAKRMGNIEASKAMLLAVEAWADAHYGRPMPVDVLGVEVEKALVLRNAPENGQSLQELADRAQDPAPDPVDVLNILIGIRRKLDKLMGEPMLPGDLLADLQAMLALCLAALDKAKVA